MPTIVDDGVGAELRLEEVMEHPGTTGHPLATHLACILSPSAAALEDHYMMIIIILMLHFIISIISRDTPGVSPSSLLEYDHQHQHHPIPQRKNMKILIDGSTSSLYNDHLILMLLAPVPQHSEQSRIPIRL